MGAAVGAAQSITDAGVGGGGGGAEGGRGGLAVRVASGDALDVYQFSIHERLSSLFSITLIVHSRNADIAFDDVVGQEANFELSHGPHSRTWTGICNHIQQLRVEEDGESSYELSIVPSLWLLTQRRNHRMFQQISELDIVKKLLGEWSIPFEEKLTETYKPRKYRVQYGESDFAFMSRMLEDAGITFYFAAVKGKTTLILADAPQSNPLRKPKIRFHDDATMAGANEHVTGVRIGQRVRPGRYTVQDHDYRRPPSYKLSKTADAAGGSVDSRLERFHYAPGAFLFRADKGDDSPVADDKGKARADDKEGEALTRKRLEAKRATGKLCTFSTDAHDLAPGMVMSMLDHPKSELGPNKKLLIVECSMSGTQNGEWMQHCEVVSAAAPYRPSLSATKPKVNGVESATVVGPAGEEIHCDEFGRVRVHFHWDRESKMDDNSSCWIHTSQPWGGAGFGGINLPRIGQEVIVDFLGGDPDRPIIVGRVYTNLQKVPYKLPDNKTQSGWKSNSTGGGGGYNEVMFEDAKGKELLSIQAEKDLKKLVKNNEDVTIGKNRTKRVKVNDSLTVGGNRTHMIAQNEQIKVGANQAVAVGVNRSTQVGSIDSTMVGDTHVVLISPPGEGGIGAGSTSITMKNKKIVLDTGAGAKITLAGSSIRIKARDISILGTNSVNVVSCGKSTLGAMNGMTVSSQSGNLLIVGKPKVKINPE
ncbi:type VI secretion system Vgr family protein [Chondromyces apiculatus]|nr:type VI secretion system tip protein TssI/VgrG [Chondromyces apiculatus]